MFQCLMKNDKCMKTIPSERKKIDTSPLEEVKVEVPDFCKWYDHTWEVVVRGECSHCKSESAFRNQPS